MGTPTLKRVNGAIILENGLVPPCSILLIDITIGLEFPQLIYFGTFDCDRLQA